jgi:hypothetical protein
MRALSICACLVAVAAYAHGQSLGEVAERTKGQRKGDGAAKALTQDDVDRAAREREAEAPPKSTPRPRPVGTPQRTPPPASGGITVLEPPSEQRTPQAVASDAAVLDAKIRSWRARYSQVQTRIEALEREIEKVREEAQDATVVTRWRNYAVDRLQKLEAELAKRKQEIDAIMEQARLDGVASGQLY